MPRARNKDDLVKFSDDKSKKGAHWSRDKSEYKSCKCSKNVFRKS